jgi:hypothetical protein
MGCLVADVLGHGFVPLLSWFFFLLPDGSDTSHHGTHEYIHLPGCCKNCFVAGGPGSIPFSEEYSWYEKIQVYACKKTWPYSAFCS